MAVKKRRKRFLVPEKSAMAPRTGAAQGHDQHGNEDGHSPLPGALSPADDLPLKVGRIDRQQDDGSVGRVAKVVQIPGPALAPGRRYCQH